MRSDWNNLGMIFLCVVGTCKNFLEEVTSSYNIYIYFFNEKWKKKTIIIHSTVERFCGQVVKSTELIL